MKLHHLAALCVSVVLVACATSKPVLTPIAQALPPAEPLPYEQWPQPFKTPKTLEEARQRRQALEQLPPDRRFLLAFGEIATLMRNDPPTVTEARFSGGRWIIVHGDRIAAEVSPFADYEELSTALARWAADVAGESKRPIPLQGDVVLIDGEAASEATSVNAAWKQGDRSPELIARAAHLLTSVAFELHDSVDVADNVFGRAWALAALARAKGRRPQSDEALLASALDYKRAAKSIAANAEDEAVRAFLTGDWKRLDALVLERPKSSGVRYLQLRAFVHAGRNDELKRIAAGVDHTTPASTISLMARCNVFELESVFPMYSAIATLEALQDRADAFGEKPDARDRRTFRRNPTMLLSRMETALQTLRLHEGVPFDTAIERSVIRAHFFSDLSAAMTFHLASRSVLAEGEELMTQLGTAEGIAGEFRNWMAFRVLAFKGLKWEDVAEAATSRWGQLGAIAVSWLLTSNKCSATPGTPAAVDGARYLMRRADSRPSLRWAVASAVEKHMVDPGLEQRLYSRCAEVSGNVVTLAWLRMTNGDWAGLEQIAGDASVDLSQRYAAIEKLFAAKQLSLDETTRRLGALEKSPGGDALFRKYEDFLDQNDRVEEQIALLTPRVNAHPDAESTLEIDIRSDLARAYRISGRYQQAWKIVEPAMDSYMATALIEGSLAKLGLGRNKEALVWAKRIVERYDRSATGSLCLARVLWRTGQAKEAAESLKGHLAMSVWLDYLPNWFIHAFEKRPMKEIEAAMDALIQVETSAELISMAKGFAKKDRLDLGVLLATKLPNRTIDMDVETWLLLKQYKGAEEADAWFWKHNTPQALARFAFPAFLRGADTLLFSLPSTPALTQKEMDVLWVLRAASLARSRTTKGPRFDLVRKHYESEVTLTPETELDIVRSRYLVGLQTKESLRAGITTPLLASQMGFYFALGAERDGDIEEAASAYLDMMDLRQGRFDWAWARMRMTEWRDSGKSLKRIAAEGR